MKIKIVSNMYYPYIGGGAELSTQVLAEGLKTKQKEIEVLTVGVKDKIEIINNIKIKRFFFNKRSIQILGGSKNSNLKKISKLDKLKLRIFDYNKKSLYRFFYQEFKISNSKIIHTTNNMMYFGLFSCWNSARDLNIKTIHTLRDPSALYFRVSKEKSLFFIDFIHRFFYRKAMNKVDLIHSPSQFMIDLHKSYGFKFKKEVIIPNTVDIKIKKNNIKNNMNEIIYVGAIEEYKGVLTLIEAFKKIKIKNKKLILIGSGNLEERIKNEYSNLNIEITGWIEKEQVYEIISKSKVLILPSEWDEAFGRVLVEGIYNETLVIGSNRGAIPEVLDYRENYIFKEKDNLGLKNKIERILKLSGKEYNLELNEMQKFMEKYSVKNHINQFVELYDNLIKEN